MLIQEKHVACVNWQNVFVRCQQSRREITLKPHTLLFSYLRIIVETVFALLLMRNDAFEVFQGKPGLPTNYVNLTSNEGPHFK